MKKIILAILLLSSLSMMAQERENGDAKLEALKKEKNQTVLQQKIKALENGTDEDLSLLIQYYDKDAAKKEVVTTKLLKKYPNTELARMVRLKAFLALKSDDPARNESLLQSMMKAYPKTNLDIEKTLVASLYGGIPNAAKVIQYINTIEDPAMRIGGLVQAIQEMIPVDSKTALTVATDELEKAKKLKDQTAPSGMMKLVPRSVYYNYINMYSKLLFKAGKDAEAYRYTAEAYDNTKNRDGELTENYAYLSVLNNSRYEASLPILARAVKEGKFEQKYIDEVRKAYTKLNPGKDVNAYVAELQKAFIDKMKTQVSKLMISEAAPDFTVTDVNGKKVSLSDFIGKTIVLDFWATWCGPCVASFPAMQMAVNRYANDPEVKFLFIDTWETAADPLADAKNFLSKRDYKFDLYMDIVDPQTKRPPAISAFGAKGIPAKFIIDGNGKIRFKVEGFEGKAEAAAEELSQMIELARKKNE